ncbi:MAG: ATP-binding protein [Sphaerochaeta sp.]|jgi:hypothetical protein|nr:ATP-binding protein [Sphaerochaeta sp.]
MIASIWGVEGSGKSSVALTWPSPLFHLDLDLGGFERAIWRIEDIFRAEKKELRILRCEPDEDISKIKWEEYDIISKPYLAPLQLEKLMGVQKQGASVRFPRQVIGYKQLWQSIVIDFVAVCQSPRVRTIVTDSATQLWTVCHTSLLQEKQEIQIAKGVKPDSNDFRERLQAIEFPNDRMRELIYTARSAGKHLIMTHYPKDVYANKVGDKGVESYATGEQTPDGFKHTVQLDDIVIRTYTELDNRKELAPGVINADYRKPRPFAKIDLKCGLSGMGMTAVGLELPEPSYQGLMQLQSLLRGE